MELHGGEKQLVMLLNYGSEESEILIKVMTGARVAKDKKGRQG